MKLTSAWPTFLKHLKQKTIWSNECGFVSVEDWLWLQMHQWFAKKLSRADKGEEVSSFPNLYLWLYFLNRPLKSIHKSNSFENVAHKLKGTFIVSGLNSHDLLALWYWKYPSNPSIGVCHFGWHKESLGTNCDVVVTAHSRSTMSF